MKFADLYPDMKPIEEEKQGIIRGRIQYHCTVCGGLTEYVEINYEAPFCSEECLDRYDASAAN